MAAGLLDRLSDLAERLGAAVLLAIACIVAFEVTSRYVFNAPTLWAQDVCVYLLLWLAFTGLAPAQRAGQHIRIDLAYTRFPPAVRRWLDVSVPLAVAAFGCAATWSGSEIVLQSLRLGRRSMSLFSVPMWVPQLALPVGYALLTIVCLAAAWRVLRRQNAA